MKNALLAAVMSAAVFSSGGNVASAHPASGIVVDSAGQVFFIYTGHGVYKVDVQGSVTNIHAIRGGHWMCLDSEGSFSRTQPKFFERISPAGEKPALIFADGGSPIAVSSSGNLYYVSNDDSFTPGGMHLTRNTPAGEISMGARELNKTTEELGITGLATGPNGDIYAASPSAIFKVKSDGTFSTIVRPIDLKDCDVDYPDNNTDITLPCLRGLAVDEHGNIFAAGTGCHRVIKVTPDGKVETILKSERPWSPTGIAVYHDDVYVLEYTHATEGADRGWLPRVRKLARDGKVSMIATIPAK